MSCISGTKIIYTIYTYTHELYTMKAHWSCEDQQRTKIVAHWDQRSIKMNNIVHYPVLIIIFVLQHHKMQSICLIISGIQMGMKDDGTMYLQRKECTYKPKTMEGRFSIWWKVFSYHLPYEVGKLVSAIFFIYRHYSDKEILKNKKVSK